ncbi:MAG TPA: hypothetical protein PLN95_02185 [Candidatus Saccharibacteria bacterium]|nr:hypothetical protein [Candidatus Saccharibacteria bacterium]
MATTAGTTRQPQVTGWTNWIVIAGSLMFLSGIVHMLYGFAGIFSQDWYVYMSGTTYMLSISDWGWTMLAIGVLLVGSAALLLAGNMLGRIVGALLAVVGMVANLALIEVTPVWSIIAIAVSIFILYAIIAHGGEMKRDHHPEQLA